MRKAVWRQRSVVLSPGYMNTQKRGNALLVRLSGELDLVTAPQFRSQVDGELANHDYLRHIILNLTQVKFIDSSGLGAILGRYKEVQGRGGKLVIVGAVPQVQQIFAVSGVLKLVEMCQSEKQAFEIIQ
ncbi:MAG: anti-sigma factor antagonist [Limnochordia bacterium]|nr:anti-sigma factor antagonist [Limnochordia bacterium]